MEVKISNNIDFAEVPAPNESSERADNLTMIYHTKGANSIACTDDNIL